MGILGSPETFFLNDTFFLNYQMMNFCSNCFFHGIDWLYINYSNLSFFYLKIWYFFFLNSIFDNSFDYFFFFFWFFNLIFSKFQLMNGIFLDYFLMVNNQKIQYSSEWFNFLLSSSDSIFILIYHPELIFMKNFMNYKFFLTLSNFYLSIFNNSNVEIFFSPIILIPQLMFLMFFFSLFLNFFFSYYSSSTMEENTIDMDFLLNSGTVESEKEMSSFDDIILAFIILFYMFGWYFYIHCWSMLNIMPELILIFYLFPLLYFMMIGMPAFLMYDFGMFFLVYLKGVGSSKIFIFELLFDYMAVMIFFTSIIVQGVSLILMLFTYISMHDLVLYFSFNQKMFFSYENIWEEFNSFSVSFDSMTYFFLFSLPGSFIYWIYEMLHTFFVMTVQFSAFFAMVFWLFLFLYTFFVLEKQENYFFSKSNKKNKN